MRISSDGYGCMKIGGYVLWHVGMPRFYVLVPVVGHGMHSDLHETLVSRMRRRVATWKTYGVAPVSTLVDWKDTKVSTCLMMCPMRSAYHTRRILMIA